MITLKFDGKIVEVKKNDAGLYCLNDIFKASGEGESKKPVKWYRGTKTSQLTIIPGKGKRGTATSRVMVV